jgi:hypothetical protein
MLAALLGCVFASNATAHLANPLLWRGPVLVDPSGGFTAITCPAASFCVAADTSGNVVTSTDPTGGVSSWAVAHVDSGDCGPRACFLTHISCPSVSFCAAVDETGALFTSTDPSAGAAGWKSVKITSKQLTAVSCPSVSLCVAVDYSGAAYTSTNPTGDAGSWSTATIDSGPCVISCRSINKGPPERQLDALACPSVSLCVAGDWEGNVVTAIDPRGGSGAWTASYVDPDQEGVHGGSIQATVSNVSCPSVSLCAASDGTGGLVTSSDPSGGASAWQLSRAAPDTGGQGGGGFWSLSCPSAWLCAALYSSSWSAPSEVALTRHLRRGTEWERVAPNPPAPLSAISCPTELLCVAGTSDGSIIVGRAAPTSRTQVRRLLQTEMRPRGRSARVDAVLSQRGYTVSLNPPEPGAITVRWVLSGRRPQHGGRGVVVAHGSGVLADVERATVRLTLTPAGRSLLRHTARLRLLAEAVFVPPHGQPLRATRSIVLHR